MIKIKLYFLPFLMAQNSGEKKLCILAETTVGDFRTKPWSPSTTVNCLFPLVHLSRYFWAWFKYIWAYWPLVTVPFAGITNNGTVMSGQFRGILELGYGFVAEPAAVVNH